jgi:hypothetical protein
LRLFPCYETERPVQFFAGLDLFNIGFANFIKKMGAAVEAEFSNRGVESLFDKFAGPIHS